MFFISCAAPKEEKAIMIKAEICKNENMDGKNGLLVFVAYKNIYEILKYINTIFNILFYNYDNLIKTIENNLKKIDGFLRFVNKCYTEINGNIEYNLVIDITKHIDQYEIKIVLNTENNQLYNSHVIYE